jgi:hypothetical protein
MDFRMKVRLSMLAGGLPGPALLREPRHPFGCDGTRRDIRQDVEHRGPIPGGGVEREPPPPTHLPAALRSDHADPLLSDVPCLHPTERVPRASKLPGQAPGCSADTGSPPRGNVAEKLTRTAVAIGNPAVTRRHRLEDAPAERALLGMAIFTRQDSAHQAPTGLVDYERRAGQGTRLNPAPFLQPMLPRFHRVAVDALHLGARQPGRACTTHVLDEGRSRAGARADQCRRGLGLDLLECVVDGDHGRPNLRFLSPLGRLY